MRLRNKCKHLKIQTADGTITPVISFFYANPCQQFNEDDFMFTNGVAMDPWTHQVLGVHIIRCTYATEALDSVEILSNIEDRDTTIECVGSSLAGFYEQMVERLKIPNSNTIRDLE